MLWALGRPAIHDGANDVGTASWSSDQPELACSGSFALRKGRREERAAASPPTCLCCASRIAYRVSHIVCIVGCIHSTHRQLIEPSPAHLRLSPRNPRRHQQHHIFFTALRCLLSCVVLTASASTPAFFLVVLPSLNSHLPSKSHHSPPLLPHLSTLTSHLSSLIPHTSSLTPQSFVLTALNSPHQASTPTMKLSRSSSPELDPSAFGVDFAPLPDYKPAGDTALDFGGLLATPLKVHEDLASGCGGQTWPAGVVLARHMLRYHREELRDARM